MSAVPPRLLRNYLFGNGVGIAITLLAGLINLVVGPRNPLIFAVIPFQIVFASTILFLADVIGRQPEPPPPFWVGKWGFPSLEVYKKKMAGNREQTMRGFFIVTPTFFLICSIGLLFGAATGTMNSLDQTLSPNPAQPPKAGPIQPQNLVEKRQVQPQSSP